MEHIHFKEKFTKTVYRQTTSIFELWDGGGGRKKLTPPPSPSKFSIFFYP